MRKSDKLERTLQEIYKAVDSGSQSPIYVKRSINKIGAQNSDKELIAYLTLDNNMSRAKVVQGRGKNFKRAVSNAIKTYLINKPGDFKPNNIKLDLVTRIQPIIEADNKQSLENTDLRINYGLDGLAFDSKLQHSLLPGEVTGYQVVKNKKIIKEQLTHAFQNHLIATKDYFSSKLEDDRTLTLYKFRTRTYFLNENTFLQLRRNHRRYKDLTRSDLWDAIELTKNNYFKHVVDKKGKFLYSYLPQTGENQKKYNILRHAGTIYSMLETYKLMPDEELLTEAKRAISFLINQIKTFEVNGIDVKVVVERDVQKVGGNALAIVALAEYTKTTGDKQYLPLMRNLATWFKEIQTDNGEFKNHKQEHSTGKVFNFTSKFYPGEAILALVRLYHIDKNEEWLNIAENAANFLINIRDKGVTSQTVTPDHWLMYALNDLYRERQNEIYLNHALLMAEGIINKQLTKKTAKRTELIGGFESKPNKTPGLTNNACWSEGLGAAYRLAYDFGHSKQALKIKNAMQLSIKYQLRGQLRPESIMYFENKSLCLGAFHKNFKDYEIRNDYTQHNISSLISLYEIWD